MVAHIFSKNKNLKDDFQTVNKQMGTRNHVYFYDWLHSSQVRLSYGYKFCSLKY